MSSSGKTQPRKTLLLDGTKVGRGTVGQHSIQNGNMTFDIWPPGSAMRHGGILLINELDLLEPSIATGFNGILISCWGYGYRLAFIK